MQNNAQYIEEDKIDLRDLIKVIKRRKHIIWSVTIFSTLLAFVYIFVSKPVYEVKSMLEIGQINGKTIDDVNDVKQKLSYEYKINSKETKKELPFVKSISTVKNSENILSLTIYANNNEEGMKYIQTVINKIKTQYKEKTDAYSNNQKKLILLTQKDIEENTKSLIDMKKELENYSQKIDSLKHEDAALAGIYALQMGQEQSGLQKLKKYISILKTQEQELKLSLTPLKIKSTHIIGEIETFKNAIKPKKKLIIIVAFIAGLMLSVFIAFFLELLQVEEKEENSE